MASDVFSIPERSIPPVSASRGPLEWRSVFPGMRKPTQRVVLVVVWASWNAHSGEALVAAEVAAHQLNRRSAGVYVATAVELTTTARDAMSFHTSLAVTLPQLRLAAAGLHFSGAFNQIPATMLFVDGKLIDRRLGAQSSGELVSWIRASVPEVRDEDDTTEPSFPNREQRQ